MSFWNIVNKVINDADVILEVVDARFIELTRHEEIEDKVKRAGKEIILVLNKCDLVEKSALEKQKRTLKNAIFVSSTTYHGLNKLRERIIIRGKQKGFEKEFDKIRVGVLGYPNVGKSSLINALKGSKAASTSRTSGHTRGVQKITKRGIIFLDTPGVLPYMEKDESKHAIVGAKDFNQLKNPEDAVFEILKVYGEKLKNHFDVFEDDELFLEEVAKKKHLLLKKGIPDTERAAREILKWWQNATHK